MRAWQLTVAPDPESELPLFLRIARAIADDIRRGRLRPGDALPGSRTLARELDVNRNTVLASYDELRAEGWVTVSGRGTRVAGEPPGRAPRLLAPRSLRSLDSARAGFDVAPALPADAPPHYAPGALMLARGTPDVRLLPTAQLARAYRRALLHHGGSLLAYGDPRGHPRLRAALATMLSAARGIAAEPDGILVTRGSQMALDLAARALLVPGDVVAVEALGHPHVRNTLHLAGAHLLPLPVDDGGLSVDALAQAAARERIRAVVVTPHHQFPTTTVMPAARRLQLLELARRHRIAVIEDDYDHEFHYDGPPVLPLASSDRSGVVLYIGTLSKILAPGLRVGFAVGPAALLERMTSVRVAADIQGDLAVECAVAALFESGELGRHVRRMRRAYRSRRDAFVSALQHQLGTALDFEVPSGGMALWARAAADVNLDGWAEQAQALGVIFRSGRLYDLADRPSPFARLGFTFHDERELAEAARRMAAALALHRRGAGAIARTRAAVPA